MLLLLVPFPEFRVNLFVSYISQLCCARSIPRCSYDVLTFLGCSGVQTEEAVKGPCKLREDFLKAANHRHLSTLNFSSDEQMHGDGLVSAVQTTKVMPGSSFDRVVETRYDIPQSFGEFYREPGEGETYASYTGSNNFWRLVGFGKDITDADNVNCESVWRYRSLILKYCGSDVVFYSLCRLTWPKWTPKY